MLLFHGTSGPRALVDKILDEGLLPHGGRAWADQLTGVAAHVFACTSPIGTRDGDPIRWAQRAAWKDRRAWLVVVDLPDSARPLVVGAIRNEDLTRYWGMQAFATFAMEQGFAGSRAVIARARERTCAVRELLTLEVTSTAEGLVEGVPDAATLVQFEAAYLRANPGQRARVAASYGVTVPAWFADDPHYGSCLACMHNLFVVELVARDVVLDGRPVRFHRGSWARLDRETLGTHLDALGRWLASCDPVALERFIATREKIELSALQRAFPPPADDVPRTFLPELASGDLDARMRLPDTQLLLARIPPEYLAGALDLGTRDRLSKLVRPTRGQTLLDNLRHLVHELRATRERTGRAVICE